MKLSTRQYAKRQVIWIKSKLIPAVQKLGNDEVTIVLLDATGESCSRLRDGRLMMEHRFIEMGR